MTFLWCTITVSDLDESIKFYRDIVGLGLNRRVAAGPETEIAFLGGGETKVELICHKGRKTAVAAENISLGFETASLEEKLSFIAEKGLIVDGGPFQPNPRIRFFFVKDPDGVRIQFVEHIGE